MVILQYNPNILLLFWFHHVTINGLNATMKLVSCYHATYYQARIRVVASSYHTSTDTIILVQLCYYQESYEWHAATMQLSWQKYYYGTGKVLACYYHATVTLFAGFKQAYSFHSDCEEVITYYESDGLTLLLSPLSFGCVRAIIFSIVSIVTDQACSVVTIN